VRRRKGVERKRPLSRWERSRTAIVSVALVTVLLGSIVLASGIRLAEMLFAQSPDAVASAEHLLGPIEDKGSLRRFADDLPPLLAVPKDLAPVIREAARAVGVDAVYLTAVAARESGFDPQAHAEGSSAVGLYQFTADTWLRVVKVFGDRYGLAPYAQQIAIGPDGQVSMPRGAARAALLKLRTDPRVSTLMAAELGRDNKARLEHILGRQVTPAETYIAHFLGVSQGAQIIVAARSSPRLAGVRLLPVAAGHNAAVFSPDGRDAGVADIVAGIDAYFDRQSLRLTRM
jgi:hypothetical protein